MTSLCSGHAMRVSERLSLGVRRDSTERSFGRMVGNNANARILRPTSLRYPGARRHFAVFHRTGESTWRGPSQGECIWGFHPEQVPAHPVRSCWCTAVLSTALGPVANQHLGQSDQPSLGPSVVRKTFPPLV